MKYLLLSMLLSFISQEVRKIESIQLRKKFTMEYLLLFQRLCLLLAKRLEKMECTQLDSREIFIHRKGRSTSWM